MEENEKLDYAELIINTLISKKNNISYKEVEDIFDYTIHCLKDKLTLQNLAPTEIKVSINNEEFANAVKKTGFSPISFSV